MTVTINQIADLYTQAGQAGDMLMCRIVELATHGKADSVELLTDKERAELATYTQETARAECERVINED